MPVRIMSFAIEANKPSATNIRRQALYLDIAWWSRRASTVTLPTPDKGCAPLLIDGVGPKCPQSGLWPSEQVGGEQTGSHPAWAQQSQAIRRCRSSHGRALKSSNVTYQRRYRYQRRYKWDFVLRQMISAHCPFGAASVN